MSLGQRLRLLDARFAPSGSATPAPGLRPAWVVGAVVLGLATFALLMASLIGNPVFAFFLAPVGIVYGWVMGRLYESKATAAGRGLTRRE